ncbi:MAG: hypothetical protein LIO53_02950 [Oscillospiraceae bacterium]|nr:hypothetical protein [Oscillospiraceae bacterium]
MNEIQIQRETALSAPNITYLPDIPANALREIDHKAISLASVNALGTCFSSVLSAIGKVTAQNGGSGLYYVNTMGKQMMSFNDGSGFLGTLTTSAGGIQGQARMIPTYINPTTLMMSTALASVSLKMEEIIALQREIMDYLQQKELANLIGNINTLSDISNNFKYNWNNEQYKTNKHNLVQVIRRDSEQSIVLSRAQIQKALNSHKPNLAEILQTEFSSYQMSLYQFAYSSYLEVMLLGNFDTGYLKSTASKIEEYIVNWRILYTDGYNKLEKLTQ